MGLTPGTGLSVVGRVDWEQWDASGVLDSSGSVPNLFLDQGRSAFAAFTRLLTVPLPRWFHFGTGTALPVITQTALQYDVTALSATGVTAEGTYTARISTTLGATQMTGLIRELLMASEAAHPTTAFARATVSASHVSGNTMVWHWRFSPQG